MALGVLSCACSSDPSGLQPGAYILKDEAAVIDALADAYRLQDRDLFESLLADDRDAPFVFLGGRVSSGDVEYWGLEQELRIHQRMFDPTDTSPGEPPVSSALAIDSVWVALEPLGEFRETDEYYRSAINPAGVDAARWRVTVARYRIGMQVYASQHYFNSTRGFATFVVLEDLTRVQGSADRFKLYQWHDDTGSTEPQKSEPSDSWTWIKRTYAGGTKADDPRATMDQLVEAFGNFDVDAFAELLFRQPGLSFGFALAPDHPSHRTALSRDEVLTAMTRFLQPATANPPIDPTWLIATSIRPGAFYPLSPFVPLPTDIAGRRFGATFWVELVVELRDGGRLLIRGPSYLVFQGTGDGPTPRYALLSWKELEHIETSRWSGSPPTHHLGWGELHVLLLPSAPLQSEMELVEALETTYWARSLNRLSKVLSVSAEAPYEFEQDASDPQTEGKSWSIEDEFWTHTRMFTTDIVTVPAELQIRHSQVVFEALGEFAEAPQWYSSPANPTGLDPARWRARAADFKSTAWFQTGALRSHFVGTPVRFVIVEDLTAAKDGERRFQLYRWIDLTANPNSMSWTDLRQMFREEP